MLSRPDVLVLGGGGVLGEAWMMGLLAGVEDGAAVDLRHCDALVGTSAGAIVAAHLAAGSSPRRPSSLSTELGVASGARSGMVLSLAGAAVGAVRRAGGAAISATALFAPLALGASAPGGALLRATLLRGLPRPDDSLADLARQVAASGARFDGRLRITAVDRASGRRTVFGRPGGVSATVAQAVQASCSVPWLFSPVAIAGREYVDGGVWSPTNLDAAPASRGSHVLCLNPTASLGGRQRLLGVVRSVSRSASSLEAHALRRRGARVLTVAPNAECAAEMGTDFMATEPRGRVLAAGYRQGLQVAIAG